MKKLLITGGHVTPAIACIDEILERKLPVEIVFVGRKQANAREKEATFEYQEITKRNIRFINLSAGRLTRALSLRSLQNILHIPVGFIEANKILSQEKPDIVLSFGGYLALPIATIASSKGIPVYTHEQTIHPGLANKIIASFAKKVFVAFPETQKYFSKEKVIVSGNPVRKAIFTVNKSLGIPTDRQVIYITGGSLGAHDINVLIEPILKNLLEEYTVVHQTGNVQEFKDYERLSKLKGQYYYPQEHFFDSEIGYIYSIADLLISRSGANTFFELIALKKPALFIPLPVSANQEQQKHAQLFKEAGVGEVYEEKDATELLQLVKKMTGDLEKYKRKFTHFAHEYPQNAAQTIITYIFQS